MNMSSYPGQIGVSLFLYGITDYYDYFPIRKENFIRKSERTNRADTVSYTAKKKAKIIRD